MYSQNLRYDQKATGERIRAYRRKLGFTRHDMAKKIGKTEKYYADIERGYCGMSLQTLIGIAGYLGLTLDSLVFGREGGEKGDQEERELVFILNHCDAEKRKKGMELLRLYLSE